MPAYDVARLLTLNIGITLSVIAVVAISTWGIIHEIRQIAASTERVARIAERIDARLRRDFPDIGEDLGD